MGWRQGAKPNDGQEGQILFNIFYKCKRLSVDRIRTVAIIFTGSPMRL